MPLETEHITELVADQNLFDPQVISYDLLMRILFTQGGVRERVKDEKTGEEKEHIVTPADLRTLRAGLTKDQIVKFLATQLRVDESEIDIKKARTPGQRERVSANFERINRAIRLARTFIREELELPLRSSFDGLEVHTLDELVAIIEKVTLFSPDNKTPLAPHLEYCALIKTVLATLELETRHAALLRGEMEWGEEYLTKPSDQNKGMPLVLKTTEWQNGQGIMGVLSNVHPPYDVVFEGRDKSWKSIVRKFLMKPESNASQAFKDEIAIRIKGDEQRTGIAERVVEYFREHFDAKDLIIENKNMMSDNEAFNALVATIRKIPGCDDVKQSSDPNPLSADSFRVLQINGQMKMPPGGKSHVPRDKWNYRSFEIQLVDTKGKANRGLASDAAYALKKDIAIVTRLFGSVTEKWLLKKAAKIENDVDTRMSAAAIIDGLERNGFLMKMQKTTGKYAATDVWDRWSKISGLVTDKEILNNAKFAVRKAKLAESKRTRKRKINT
ncbi:MAG: hypothetical protein Q7S76_00500 [bacterium]|nr:hypothetical protein [bacterium]